MNGMTGIGIWSTELRFGEPDAIPDAAAELEQLGFSALWLPGVAGGPIFDAVDRVLQATREIPVATGIVNIWGHDSAEAVERHAAFAEAYPGRFMLGLGASHPAIVDGFSLGHYDKPLTAMRAFLDALDAADRPVPVSDRCLAALKPRMRALAAERTAGAHPYFVTPAHTRAARESMGPDAMLAPEQTVVLEADPDRARALARRFAQTYLQLPNYTNNLLDFGYTEADIADGGSDRLIDDVVAWGDPDRIRARVQEHIDAGADHVCLQVVTDDHDPMGAMTGTPMPLPRTAWQDLATAVLG